MRVLPTKRYLPASIDHQRWLRSSPVEVAGAEIGRINARQSEDGRIEFAFTPTDGEQITPQARYFPADARIDRWLRSTEITIGPPVDDEAPYTAISAGSEHACAIRDTGAIECWGRNDVGQTDAPAGSFTAVSAGSEHTCAIRDTGAIECWGRNDVGQTDASAGSFTAVSAGSEHACAIREGSRAITCWGSNQGRIFDRDTWAWPRIEAGQADAPAGSFIAVSAGGSLHGFLSGRGYSCAIREGGAMECWGEIP